ncbi:SDR family oxidoreductase [Candidatus Gottesmanbacteria bacterium]|nr:SDR family oxidoreductase [Candidatus Gottesmanbacteria bacterium]
METREVGKGTAVNIIGTGLSGLVGSRVVELLAGDFQFENLSLETGVDITNNEVVRERFAASGAPWVFHFAAVTDLDASEKERQLGEKSLAWRVNVEGTRNIVEAAQAGGKRVLYLSTDFVFDGNGGPYTEESQPNPQSWYAVTKYEGEKLVAGMDRKGIILRIAFPYQARPQGRPDFVHRIIEELRAGKDIEAPDDQRITPTYIDDVAHAIRVLTGSDASGIYHAVGSQALSPFDVVRLIARTHHLDVSQIAPTSAESYYKGRAPRPRKAVLKNDKIEFLGICMKTFEEGLRLL